VAPPENPILQRFTLGMPWQTVDPFLFCVHHDDRYPAGNGALAPSAGIGGRSLGNDFSGRDGWSMYHGGVVPGFPQHPHRGFETVTFVRRGYVDHSDSLGAAARYGAGDVQWLTAGGGIVHAEMFPLLSTDRGNHLDLFQIWVNLPRADKMSSPHFSMLWAEDIPVVEEDGAEITVVAGTYRGHVPPAPPPHSWASKPGADVAIWRVAIGAGATWVAPRAADTSLRCIYAFEGSGIEIDGRALATGEGAVVEAGGDRRVTAGAGGATLLVLQGRPIGEPVARYGPFVMNDRAGIEQAFRDYQRTEFGGWPWPVDDPTHGQATERFARRPDGAIERPPVRDLPVTA
jgi:hypothetical protein